MKTCKHCGSQLEEQAKFCRYCGKPAEEETPYNYQQQDTGYGYGGQQPGDQVYQSSSYNQNYSGYQQQYSQPSYNQQAYNQQQYNQQPYKQGGKTCGMAVASLVLGLVGIFLGYLGAAFSAAASFPGMGFMWIIAIAFFMPSILAVLLGISGISKTKEPGVTGRGLAIAGLVLGIVFLVIWGIAAVFAAQAIGTYGSYFSDLFY